MQVYISNREITQIAEGLVQAACGHTSRRKIDIDAVAEYLGLTVVYEQIAEDDLDRIAFTSNGFRELQVIRNGQKIKVLFRKNTIVLDKFLLQPQEETRRRLALAHEISHILIGHADPVQAAPCFNSVYDKEREYRMCEMNERMTLAECQANMMAAMILMSAAVLTDSVRRHFRRKMIPVYGNCIFLSKTKPVLHRMATELGVSHTALIIQLRKYNLLEQRDMHEYFQLIMKDGGDSIE